MDITERAVPGIPEAIRAYSMTITPRAMLKMCIRDRCKTDRENYEKYWDDISPFIKFGCIKDEKFCERMMEYVLFKDLDGKYTTMNEYLEAQKPAAGEAETDKAEEKTEEKADEKADGEEKETPKTTIYYVTDVVQQSQYINMFLSLIHIWSS